MQKQEQEQGQDNDDAKRHHTFSDMSQIIIEALVPVLTCSVQYMGSIQAQPRGHTKLGPSSTIIETFQNVTCFIYRLLSGQRPLHAPYSIVKVTIILMPTIETLREFPSLNVTKTDFNIFISSINRR